MRKYLTGVLALSVLVLVSMLYRQGQMNAFAGFGKASSEPGEPVLYLYGFFSSESCAPCGELIGVLNSLPEHFRVTGVVPRSEASRIELLKEEYQIRFPVKSAAEYRRHLPIITPTVMGVSAGGRILFVLPCPTLRPDEITAFLAGFRMKLAPALADGSF